MFIFRKVASMIGWFARMIGGKKIDERFDEGATYGGFTDSDWINVGNDLKRSIIDLGEKHI